MQSNNPTYHTDSLDGLLFDAIATALLDVVPEEKLPELESLLAQQDAEGLETFFSHASYDPHTLSIHIFSR